MSFTTNSTLFRTDPGCWLADSARRSREREGSPHTMDGDQRRRPKLLVDGRLRTLRTPRQRGCRKTLAGFARRLLVTRYVDVCEDLAGILPRGADRSTSRSQTTSCEGGATE